MRVLRSLSFHTSIYDNSVDFLLIFLGMKLGKMSELFGLCFLFNILCFFFLQNFFRVYKFHVPLLNTKWIIFEYIKIS